MNLPNFLTLLRIFFVPMLVAALVQENLHLEIRGFTLTNELLALTIFLAAAGTDFVDGYLARRWDQITTVGTLLDPIADKLLISAALIALVQVDQVPGWIAIIIIAREFAVTGLRSIAAVEGYTIRASELGKTKMMLQVLAISLVMVAVPWPAYRSLAIWSLWVVVAFAVVSAVDYFRRFWRKVDESVKQRRRHELLMLEREQQRERMRLRKLQRGNPNSTDGPG